MRRIFQGRPSEHLPREADASACPPNVPIMAVPTGDFDQQDFTLHLATRSVCFKPLPAMEEVPPCPRLLPPTAWALVKPFSPDFSVILNPPPPALLPQLVLFKFVTTTKKIKKQLTASLPCIKTQLVFYQRQPELHQSPDKYISGEIKNCRLHLHNIKITVSTNKIKRISPHLSHRGLA